MLKLRKNKKGFTLVELIVVIAIMAVRAGTVAGVTVSQLNKQTDNNGVTQAKLIADYVVQEIGAEPENILDESGDTAKFKKNGDTYVIDTKIKTEMKNDKIEYADGKGKILITVSDSSVTIQYKSKQNKKGITYTVSCDGTITSAKDA